MASPLLAPPRLVDEGLILEAADIADRAARIAAGLAAQGVRAGDVVAWWLPSWWEAVALYHACWCIGAVAAPVHHRATLAEAEALLARIRPRAVFVADGFPQLAGAGRVRGTDDVLTRWLERVPVPAADVAGDVLAVLLATSGSSGRPKIAQHTRAALAYKARLMVDVHGLTAVDAILMPAPLAHVSGLLNGVLLPGEAGMTTVLMERWSPAAGLDLVEIHRVSFLIGPPTYFVQMMAEPSFSADAVRSVRLISCGGAGVTSEFARTAAGAFDAVVKRTYGSTEAPTVTTSYAGDPIERGWKTDGRPVGDVALRFVDSELQVRGRELFTGYLDDPDPFVDGWFPTGDRGRLDGEWLTITGRAGDTIIRGGENVDPAEVEAVCASLPGVRQVVVVGYPDHMMGERVGLIVLGDEVSVEQVREHCGAAGLATFKTPDRVLRVDEMPILTVGKPDRATLSAALSAGG